MNCCWRVSVLHVDDVTNVRRAQGLELGKITVGLRYTTAEDQPDHIDRRLSFSKPLSTEQMDRLLEIAAKTPVTRTLQTGVKIDTKIILPGADRTASQP